MSYEASASILLGALVPVSALDKFIVRTEEVTHTEPRFSEKTGKPIKPVVVRDKLATWGYKFDEDHVAVADMLSPQFEDLKNLDDLREVLGQFLGLGVSYVDDGDEIETLAIGFDVEGSVEASCHGYYSLCSDPFTDLPSLLSRSEYVAAVLKEKLDYEATVGLITTLTIMD